MSPSGSIHVWSRCHHCGMSPVVGPLFRCQTCPLGPDIDLCFACHEGYLVAEVAHPLQLPSAPGAHQFARSEGDPPAQFAPWLRFSSSQREAPQVPSGFIVRPEFFHKSGSVFGGYGFVIWFAAQALLVTALHVMDELLKAKQIDATGRNPHYTGKEMPTHVSSVQLYDVLKEQWPFYELAHAGPMLVLSGARTGDAEPFAFRDIAAFRVPSLGLLNVGTLAEKEPEPGEPLWLAAAMPDRSRTRRAVCVERTSNSFVFRYDEAKEMPRYSSGAPLLDEDGAVVGINTGYGAFEGHQFGHANPLHSIRAHLRVATSLRSA